MVRHHNANQERDKKKLIRVDKDGKKPDKIILRDQLRLLPCTKVSRNIDCEQKKRSKQGSSTRFEARIRTSKRMTIIKMTRATAKSNGQTYEVKENTNL